MGAMVVAKMMNSVAHKKRAFSYGISKNMSLSTACCWCEFSVGFSDTALGLLPEGKFDKLVGFNQSSLD